MNFPLFVGILCLSLFCYALLCVLSSFAIILKRNREPVALLLLSYGCIVTVNVMWLFLTVLWVGLQCVIVVFLDHTHLLFEKQFCLLFEWPLKTGFTIYVTIFRVRVTGRFTSKGNTLNIMDI